MAGPTAARGVLTPQQAADSGRRLVSTACPAVSHRVTALANSSAVALAPIELLALAYPAPSGFPCAGRTLADGLDFRGDSYFDPSRSSEAPGHTHTSWTSQWLHLS
jgi:hypothetical protein